MANIFGGVTSINNPRTNWAQTDSKKADYLKNKPSVANALKGHKSGQSVSADDVSPMEHELDIKLTGENLGGTKVKRLGKNFADLAGLPDDLKRSPSNYNAKTGPTYEITDDNKIILKAPTETASGPQATSEILFKQLFPDAREGMTLRLSADDEVSEGASNPSPIVWISGIGVYFAYSKSGSPLTVTQEMLNSKITFYTTTTVGGTVTLSNFQMELGDTATEYEPYIEPVEAIADAEGNVKGLMSMSPSVTLTTDNEGAVIDCTYIRDANKVITDLETKLNTLVATIGG